MQSVFDVATYDDLVRRIAALRPDSPRQWGKMTPSQMLEHTARVLEMATGRKPSKQMLVGKMISWAFRGQFLGEKPFGKNSPTGPDFVITDQPNFAMTKTRVIGLLQELHQLGEQGTDGHVHGFFGPLTGAQWGQTQFKHIDHHLRQFGV